MTSYAIIQNQRKKNKKLLKMPLLPRKKRKRNPPIPSKLTQIQKKKKVMEKIQVMKNLLNRRVNKLTNQSQIALRTLISSIHLKQSAVRNIKSKITKMKRMMRKNVILITKTKRMKTNVILMTRMKKMKKNAILMKKMTRTRKKRVNHLNKMKKMKQRNRAKKKNKYKKLKKKLANR